VKPRLLPLGAALAGVLFTAAVLRKGVVMGADSWAYWEGSVSLLESGKYSYFGGEGITSFPPLFSMTLALGQAALGVSVRTLAVILAALVAIGSFAWVALFRVIRGRPDTVSLSDLLAAVYVPATLAVYAQVLLSETLWLALLPFFLLVTMAPHRSSSLPMWAARVAAAWLALVALLLCRNVTVALLPAAFFLLVGMDRERPLAARLAAALAVTATAPIPWYWVRRSLNQLYNHPLGTDQQGVLVHTREMLAGMAYAFGPEQRGIGTILLVAAVGLLCWDLAARRSPGRADPLRGLAGFAMLGLAGMVASFSATHVGEPLGGRFVVYAALVLVLVVLAAGQWRQAPLRARALTALGAALTAVALYRAGTKCRLAGIEQPTSAFNVTLSPSYWTGPPHEVGGNLLVAPPTYPWLRRSGLR
jgi:hypothetical protein